jgi:hypothetical protein
MERLCREIATSHAQRQALLKELKTGALRLREETTRRLQGFRRQSEMLRGDLLAVRSAWQKATAVLAKRRRHPKRGVK